MDPAELKNKAEAVLFAYGKKVSVDHLAKLTKSSKDQVIGALNELKQEYANKNSSLSIIDEGDHWKLMVRENYSPIVRKIVTKTELTKTMIETLAVIAWKAPVLQSEVIRIRTNKAYDHLLEIEKIGFITREKKGRTQMIKLSQKFHDYFDVHNEQEIKNKFKNFKEQAEKEVQSTEKPVEQAVQTTLPVEAKQDVAKLVEEPKKEDIKN